MRPSLESKTATQRQLGTFAHTIIISIMIGTHRNMPTTPQIVPQNARSKNDGKELMLSERPVSSCGFDHITNNQLNGREADGYAEEGHEHAVRPHRSSYQMEYIVIRRCCQ